MSTASDKDQDTSTFAWNYKHGFTDGQNGQSKHAQTFKLEPSFAYAEHNSFERPCTVFSCQKD